MLFKQSLMTDSNHRCRVLIRNALNHLANKTNSHFIFTIISGIQRWDRTNNLLINTQVLHQIELTG